MTVLVTAASRHGGTAEIAAAIGRVLRERGVVADVVPVEDVDSLAEYDAVVLGSGVYVGRWLESARTFVDRHGNDLAARPVWLFSSGPIEGKGDVDVEPIVSTVAPEAHRVFGGRVDRSRLALAERAILRAVRAREGDYRDWRAIRGYAQEIAETVSA
ncbi:MAG TPA: flavodoxin domain-containing protein [Gaiellaceae bacterium]|nr:flavodoxin domain-containing protein [Gaiellaceae bacterium]